MKSIIDCKQRRKLPADKLDIYLERMERTNVKKPFTRFENKVDLKDVKEFVEAFGLIENIGKLLQHLCDYDADDVFNIITYGEKDPSNVSAPENILNLEKYFWSRMMM